MGSSRAIDSRAYNHAVWRVAIPDMGSYALDIASRQYGYHDPIHPWVEYMKQRVESIVVVNPFGLLKQSFEEQLLRVKPPQSSTSEREGVSVHIAVLDLSMEFMKGLNTAVQEWLEKEGWTDMDKMLWMAPKQFEEKQSGLLKDINDYLQDFKEWHIDQGTFGQRFKKDIVPKSPKDKMMDELVEAVKKTKERTGLSMDVIMQDVIEKAIALKGSAEEKRLLGI